ncbi:hypothetical protein PMZ80_001012 [Knufia obscura]|uniref:Uncharacterized protein n=2 Tax=Knufia TaxID=430999 RepID=A0AAN8EAL3_9EURO|nr:hypothetical protein PMZ80_001012 [Knufia obscura]KAK5950193.1 hypothetical protein OHC33_008661 [Knufia fluminis]
MYGEAMHDLWGQDRAEDAFLLHNYLVSKGDLPSKFEDIKPFMVHLATEGHDPRSFLRRLAAAGAYFAGQGIQAFNMEKYEPGAATRLGQSNKISDSFAAKAFATKPLSFLFVLRSLQAFGLAQIGPQAIRELGLAASDLDDLAERLARLDELGIDTGSSNYSMIVRKLCSAKEHTLLQQVLRTDMHHEVFESRPLLVRLLSDHLHNAQWDQVNLLLVVLNNGDTQQLSTQAKHELFETAMIQPRTMLGLATSNSAGLSTFYRHDLHYTVVKLLDSLRAMKRERRRRSSRLAMARFTAGFMQDAVAALGHMKSHHWRVLFAQLGQLGALDDVATLSHWVAKTVTQESQNDMVNREGVAFHVHYLEKLFDGKYQAAVMHWAMKRSMTSRLRAEDQRWKSSLLFLKHLEQEFGVVTRLDAIRKVVVMRCRYLRHRRQYRLFRSPVGFCSEVIRFMHSQWSLSDSYKKQQMAVALRSLATQKKRRKSFPRREGPRIPRMKLRGQQ